MPKCGAKTASGGACGHLVKAGRCAQHRGASQVSPPKKAPASAKKANAGPKQAKVWIVSVATDPSRSSYTPIGVYSSLAKAKAALRVYDNQDGFGIDSDMYTIDVKVMDMPASS